MPTAQLPEEADPKDKMAADLMQWITEAAQDSPEEGDKTPSFLDDILPPPQEFQDGFLAEKQEEIKLELVDDHLLVKQLPDASVGIMWPLLSSELDKQFSTAALPNEEESSSKPKVVEEDSLSENQEGLKGLPEAVAMNLVEEKPSISPGAEGNKVPEETKEIPEDVSVVEVEEEDKVSSWEDFSADLGTETAVDFSVLDADQGMGSDFGSAEKPSHHPASYTEEEKPLILLESSPEGTPSPPRSDSTSTTEMKVSDSDAGDVQADLEQLDEWMQQDPSLQACPTTEDLEVSDWTAGEEDYVTASEAEPESTTKTEASGPDFMLPGSTDERWYNTSLPAFECRNEILRLVRDNNVSVITGNTGCGKSTHVPLFIMDEMEIRGSTSKTCNILAVLPRRIAVTSLSSYICQKRGYVLGKKIGYQVGMQSAVRSRGTKIMFVTIGVFLQRVCNMLSKSDDPSTEDPLDGYSHVIIDEVHERSEDVDFAMLLMRQAVGKTKAKIILMSATMSLKPFLDYFKDDTTLLRPKHFDITGKPAQSVEVVYLDSIVNDSPAFSRDKPYFSDPLMDLVLRHIDREFHRYPNKKDQGTILIFLPGLDHIERMLERIKEDFGFRIPKNWEVCTLHSLLSQRVQAKVFRKLRPYVLRIVLATNIAESSITVPEVERVYDFCLTKRMVTDKETKMTFLQMQWASQSNCDQRKGRAGRVRDGKVFRLVPQWFYDELEKHPRPELSLVAPTTSILRLKVVGFHSSPLEQMSNNMMGPEKPDVQEVQRAILWLKEKGALSLYHKKQLKTDDGDLTFLGRICFTLPLSPPLCRLIYFAFSFGMVDDGIVLACVINAKSLLSSAIRSQDSGYFSKRSFDAGMKSDSLASFRAFRVWMSRVEAGEFPALNQEAEDSDKSRAEQRWCDANSLSVIRLRETRIMVYEIRFRIFQLGLYNGNPNYFKKEFEADPTWQLVMKIILAGAFYPDYVISSPKLNPDDTVETLKDAAEVNFQKFAGLDPFRTVQVTAPGQMKFLMPLFYDAQLRRWLAFVTGSDMTPEIIYRGNQAFISLNPTVDDAPNSTLLSVESLIRSNHRNSYGRRVVDVNFDAIDNSCGRDLLRQLPDLQRYCDLPFQELPWFKIGRTPDMRQIPVAMFPAVQSQLKCPSRPQISITQTVDEYSFYARIFQSGPDPILEVDNLIVTLMAARCCRPPVPSEFPTLTGRFVLGELKTSVSKYGRAQVMRSCKGGIIEVFFMDYGIRSLVACDTLRFVPPFEKLSKPFWETPALALKCSLPHQYVYCGTEEGKLDIWSRYGKANLWCDIGKSHGNGAIVYDLFTVDPISGFHLSAYRKLQEQSMFYKDEFALTPRIFPLENVVVIPHSSLPDPVFLLNDSVGPNGTVKIPLPGQPDSPFEVQAFAGGDYRWTYRVPRMIQIQSESLNNVLLRKQKPDPVNYVLVSEEAVVTRAKNAVVALQTTLMPHTPAMAAMISALFAPTMEVRPDAADPKKVAGFLCGLGAGRDESDHHASSLFLAHDFFVYSDGILDHDDVETIHQLRGAINTVPVEANEYILTGRTITEENDYFQQASEIQIGLREMLVTLFRRFRPVKLPCEAGPSDPISSLFWKTAHPDVVSLPAAPAERRSLLNRISYD